MNNVNVIFIRKFNNRDSIIVHPIYQYDVGQILHFEDELPDGTLVQFKYQNTTMDKAIVNRQVQIPSELLKDSTELVAWVQIINSESETTIKEIKIPIKIKNQGAGVTTPEDEQTFKEWIEQTMNDTKAIAKETKEAMENFELSDEQIAEVAKNIDLSDYVPTERKVANLPLTEDITPLQLINAIQGNSASGMRLSEIIQGTIRTYGGDKANLNTTDKSSYVGAINEVFANKCNLYQGNGAPQVDISKFPNIRKGDLYFDTQSRILYVCSIFPVQGAVGWTKVVLASDLNNYDTSTEVDEKISTAIDEAIGSVLGGAY